MLLPVWKTVSLWSLSRAVPSGRTLPTVPPLDPSFLSEPDVVRLRLTQLAGQLKVRIVSRRGARNMHKGVAVDQPAQFGGVEIADGPAFEPDTELGVKRGHDAQVSSMG